MTYGRAFYDTIRAGVQESARVVVPMFIDKVRTVDTGSPRRVIDVGCGEGWWANEFAHYDAEVIGVDGSYVDSSPLGNRFIPHDLRTPLPAHLSGRFDLAVCLEVAEHLPASRAWTFVTELCSLAPVILWSAAIPGQGGHGHVNEQWPAYWIELFDRHGYQASGALRWEIFDNPSVENWYAQNLLLFVRDPERHLHLSCWQDLFTGAAAVPFPVVHPTLYNARRLH